MLILRVRFHIFVLILESILNFRFLIQTKVVLTCGEDGNVFRYDPREPVTSSTGRGLRPFLKYRVPRQIRLSRRDPDTEMPAEHNTIDFNKSGNNQFALGGRYHSALVYDYRKVASSNSDYGKQ